MPITKSAKKALRQSQKRKLLNLAWKDKIKKTQKDINKLIAGKKNVEAKKLLDVFYKTVDKAVKNNILKKNTAARKKSSLAKKVTPKKSK